MRRHGLENALVQSYAGLGEFSCANGMGFSNLVVVVARKLGVACFYYGRAMSTARPQQTIADEPLRNP